MTIIDSQVHAYEANTPKRPWHSVPNWPAHVTGDEMVAAMDKVGVDGAIFISAFGCIAMTPATRWRCNARIPIASQSSSRSIRTIPRWMTSSPRGSDAGNGRHPHHADQGAGARRHRDPGLDRIPRAAVKHDFPVNILCWGNLDAGTALIDRHPDTRFIIDHLGIMQPRTPPAPPQPWADLPKVLELAKRTNAVIKVSGACTLSQQPYPFPDIWDPLARVFDAWGFDRCLWGTDWTRAFAVVNYEQAVEPFLRTDRLSDSRAGDADGRRLRQSLSLVAEITMTDEPVQLNVLMSGGFAPPTSNCCRTSSGRPASRSRPDPAPRRERVPHTIAAQLARGTPADVVILSREGLGDLIAANKIVAGTDIDLARVPLGVAVRAGTAKPDVSTIEAFRQILLKAKTVAIPESTSGIWLTTDLFPRLGIADKINVKAMPRGSAAAGLVAAGAADLAVMPVSEIVHAAGVDVAGSLAPEIQFVQVFSAAVVAGSTEIDRSKRLIEFLASARACTAISDSGMEPFATAR